MNAEAARRPPLSSLPASAGMALGAALDAPDAAERFLRCLRDGLPDSASAVVLLYDARAEALRVLAADGPERDRFADRVFPLARLPERIRLEMLDQTEPGGFRQIPEFSTPAVGADGAVPPPRLFQGLPLVARRRLVGVLLTVAPEILDWPAHVEDSIVGLACHLASALDVAILVEALETQENERAALMAVVSHELRTPLTAIRGFSEMIRDEEFGPEDTRFYAASIHRSAKRLNRMISEMVDLYRLETGRITLRVEPVDLTGITALVIEEFRADLPERSLELTFEVALPPVLGDIERLQQAIACLVARAVENAPDRGAIQLQLHKDDTGVHLEVRDHGAGMSDEALRNLFDRFNGGLSLPLARQITLRHGGRLWAESAPGAGTTFHLALPPAPVAG